MDVKVWEPLAFNKNIEKLEINYNGVGSVKFFELFKSKILNSSKGDFETSVEFSKRMENVDNLIFPLNTSDSYAFQINGIPFKYNADNQTYKVGHDLTSLCKSNDSLEKSKKWITCRITSIGLTNDT